MVSLRMLFFVLFQGILISEIKSDYKVHICQDDCNLKWFALISKQSRISTLDYFVYVLEDLDIEQSFFTGHFLGPDRSRHIYYVYGAQSKVELIDYLKLNTRYRVLLKRLLIDRETIIKS